jgi:hypothetical protein
MDTVRALLVRIRSISDPYPISVEYPIRIRIRIRKIITDMDTVRALSVRIRSVCNPSNFTPPQIFSNYFYLLR